MDICRVQNVENQRVVMAALLRFLNLLMKKENYHREVLRMCLAIQTAGIHNLDMVIKLIQAYRHIGLIIAVHTSVHHQLSQSVVRLRYGAHTEGIADRGKGGNTGCMKSLWLFMREKNITEAIRCSLENFGSFEYSGKEDNGAIRHVKVCPLYAVAGM